MMLAGNSTSNSRKANSHRKETQTTMQFILRCMTNPSPCSIGSDLLKNTTQTVLAGYILVKFLRRNLSTKRINCAPYLRCKLLHLTQIIHTGGLQNMTVHWLTFNTMIKKSQSNKVGQYIRQNVFRF